MVSPRFAGLLLGGGGCPGRLSRQASAANGSTALPRSAVDSKGLVLKVEFEKSLRNWDFAACHYRSLLILNHLESMAGTKVLEPATSAVTGQRSNQLSYVPRQNLAIGIGPTEEIRVPVSLRRLTAPGRIRTRAGGMRFTASTILSVSESHRFGASGPVPIRRISRVPAPLSRSLST